MEGCFICGDCGKFGEASELSFCVPPEYIGENTGAVSMAKTNSMLYVGCPNCKSPTVYLQKTTKPVASKNSKPVVKPTPVVLDNFDLDNGEDIGLGDCDPLTEDDIKPAPVTKSSPTPHVSRPKSVLKKKCKRCDEEFKIKASLSDISHCPKCMKEFTGG